MGKEIKRMFDKQNFLCHIASHRPLDGACRDLFHPLLRLLPFLKAPCLIPRQFSYRYQIDWTVMNSNWIFLRDDRNSFEWHIPCAV